MTPLRLLYLALAVIGAVVPMRYFFAWFAEHGYSLSTLLAAWTANAATKGIMWDVTIAAIAFTIFIVVEVMIRRDYWVLICIPAIMCVGLSFGLPLYLFLRSRPVT